MTCSAQTTPPSNEDTRAKIRDDLIRRLFAVAISVGAAATLAQMQWVQVGRWPCKAEWQQLFILVAALTATVLSWDGYLFAIAERPLRSFWRFAIDILLVFIYMFLLMTSTDCRSQGPMSQQITDGSGRNELHSQKMVQLVGFRDPNARKHEGAASAAAVLASAS